MLAQHRYFRILLSPSPAVPSPILRGAIVTKRPQITARLAFRTKLDVAQVVSADQVDTYISELPGSLGVHSRKYAGSARDRLVLFASQDGHIADGLLRASSQPPPV